ncbi:MAG: glucosaminidase domain-containing protein [Pseudomonadales bacterium]|jgi:Bax protein|nr:glucosaminidase domain-containing protein [Pseudomonadales bacterium]MDP7596081.1 glucosaminidase domain-containing protein [Pseudomonadales bacterium]HJN52269.1 glucosaminidase domain-containing protein [Pseudomonadales bacterium]|tara:strand:+ start:4737 stop:5618 length:882 start_codon:yes stop_codon:yes gene_type:complete
MRLRFHQKLILLGVVLTIGTAVKIDFRGTGIEVYTQHTLETSEVAAKKILDSRPTESPPDLATRKQSFIEFVLPSIELENQSIGRIREELSRLQLKPLLSSEERDWLGSLASQYRIYSSPSDKASIAKLLTRVDRLPPSLVLAQAAIESAWGTSRFAQHGNNLFGQWCMTAGCGLVPLERAETASHEVRKFDSVQDSVHGYFMNINTHLAYRGLRELRSCQRVKGELLSGAMLAAGLLDYSARGAAYVETVRSVIRFNRLESLDKVGLTSIFTESRCFQADQQLDSTLVTTGA